MSFQQWVGSMRFDLREVIQAIDVRIRLRGISTGGELLVVGQQISVVVTFGSRTEVTKECFLPFIAQPIVVRVKYGSESTARDRSQFLW